MSPDQNEARIFGVVIKGKETAISIGVVFVVAILAFTFSPAARNAVVCMVTASKHCESSYEKKEEVIPTATSGENETKTEHDLDKTNVDVTKSTQTKREEIYYSQLASRKTQIDAENLYAEFINQNKSFAPKYPHVVQRVNLPGKGIYYRLRLGPFKARLQADSVCVEIRKVAGYECKVFNGVN